MTSFPAFDLDWDGEADFQAALQRNARLLALARQNGVLPDVRYSEQLEHNVWHVPPHWVPIVGYMVAVLPN